MRLVLPSLYLLAVSAAPIKIKPVLGAAVLSSSVATGAAFSMLPQRQHALSNLPGVTGRQSLALSGTFHDGEQSEQNMESARRKLEQQQYVSISYFQG
jgi:hypothetical protein